MSVTYRCATCGREHASRVRASSKERLAQLTPCLGRIMEVCPDTGGWVPVLSAELEWKDAPRRHPVR
jgi:hypothetical protein